MAIGWDMDMDLDMDLDMRVHLREEASPLIRVAALAKALEYSGRKFISRIAMQPSDQMSAASAKRWPERTSGAR